MKGLVTVRILYLRCFGSTNWYTKVVYKGKDIVIGDIYHTIYS